VSKSKKKQAWEDERIRNAICQKVWGLRQRRFGLNRVMAKLDNTSSTVIAITFLVMNLSTWWRRVFCVFLYLFGKRTPVFWLKIIYNYNWDNSIEKNLSLTELEYIDRSCSWNSDRLFSKPYLEVSDSQKRGAVAALNMLSPTHKNLSVFLNS